MARSKREGESEIFCEGETWQHLLGVDRDRGDDCAASWRRGRRDYDWYIYGFGFEYILTGPTHVLDCSTRVSEIAKI